MRAEQWMMVGVGVIGLYAIYRLSKASNTPTAEPPTLGPSQVPTVPDDRSSNPTLPATGGPVDPWPNNLLVLTGPTLNLRGGGWYKGRIEVAPGASNAEIQTLLGSIGLVQAEVFRNADAASAVLQQPFALARPGQGTKWFRARVSALDSGTRPRPSWLVTIWQASPPAS